LGKEEQLLSASIQDTLREAERASRSLIRERENHGFRNPGPDDDGSYADAEGALEWWLNKAFRDTAILAERLNLPGFRADILAAKMKLRNIAGIAPDSEDHIYCPGLLLASSLYESLAVMTESGAVTGLGVLQTILQNTGRIISDEHLVPKSEKNVRDAVFQKLSYAFDDVVREPTLAHPLKNYKPDFGIKSLMALIEYKYVRTKAKLGTALDELLIDMKGYSGHADWRNFFAVVYMAGAYATQDAVDAKFTSVRGDTIWKIILITASIS
jgi:REase_DpnII-MboI